MGQPMVSCRFFPKKSSWSEPKGSTERLCNRASLHVNRLDRLKRLNCLNLNHLKPSWRMESNGKSKHIHHEIGVYDVNEGCVSLGEN